MIDRIHHVAYRCRGAKQTVLWYEQHVGMRFVLAFAQDEVPSTSGPDPYMHVLLDAGDGNVLAFFEKLAADCGTPEMLKRLDEAKWDMLEEWSLARRAPKHAASLHDGSAA